MKKPDSELHLIQLLKEILIGLSYFASTLISIELPLLDLLDTVSIPWFGSGISCSF